MCGRSILLHLLVLGRALSYARGFISNYEPKMEYTLQEKAAACSAAPADPLRVASAANLVCGDYPRPRVAVCIAGTARSVVQPLVHQTLRTNLIEAFGGNADLFAYIRLIDGHSNPAFKDSVVDGADVRAALLHIGVPVEHSEVDSTTANVTMPECAVASHNAPVSWDNPRYQASAFGQIHNRYKCYSAIADAEARHDQRYEYVITVRPDLVWPVAVRPYCFWDLGLGWHKMDWIFMTPRTGMERALMEPYKGLAECTRPLDRSFDDFFMAAYEYHDATDRLSGYPARVKRDMDVGVEATTRYGCLPSVRKQRLLAPNESQYLRPYPPMGGTSSSENLAGRRSDYYEFCARTSHDNPCNNLEPQELQKLQSTWPKRARAHHAAA